MGEVRQRPSRGFDNALAGGEDRAKVEEKAQAVMEDNLELMREVVMLIREDEDFARSIYSDCPRLQHLLDKHPDLRPVFEDPELIRINFEEVYRKNGGVLPEDELKKPPAWKRCVSCIVNHPLFKVFRVLLFIKKVLNCIMGGGFAIIRGCFAGCIGGFCMEEALDHVGDHDALGDAGADNGPNSANRAQLNKAADHMAEPEVQEKMNQVLESGDQEQLDQLIENDKELKALRDQNPLCAELMNDPETMRILVDPDNLRALADAPDLIAEDFADPDWVAPDDIEGGGNLDSPDIDATADAEAPEGALEADADGEIESDFDEENPDLEGEGDDEEGPAYEDFEMGDDDGGNQARGGNKSKGNKNQQQKKNNNENKGGNMFTNFGAGLTDWVAGELVGVSAGDFMVGGGDDIPIDDLDAVDDAADGAGEAAQTADQMNTAAQSAAATADLLASDGLADNLDHLDTLEDQMDNAEGIHEDTQDTRDAERNQRIAAMSAGGVAGGAAGAMCDGGVKARSATDENEETDTDEEEPKKKGRFGFVGKFVASVATAAKEHVASTLLGDDLGEMLVEKVEEDKDEEEQKKSENDEDVESGNPQAVATSSRGEPSEHSEKTEESSDSSQKRSRRKMFGRRK